MSGDKELTKTIYVPQNTGVEGFLHAVREVVKLPRVQKIIIDKKGSVTFTRVAREDDSENTLNVSFDHLNPYQIIRNARTQELSYPAALNASAVIAAMFDAVANSGMTPIAFVVSPSTMLWHWLYFMDDVEVASRDSFFGFPLYTDHHIPETALVLCAGVERATSLIDTKLSLKIEMLRSTPILNEEVDVE